METFCREAHLSDSKMDLKYQLSDRNLEEIMVERGDESRPNNIHEMGISIFTWNRTENQKAFRTANNLWRVNETYMKLKRKWKYPYKAVDYDGNTIDFI